MKKDKFYEVLDKKIEAYNKRLGYMSNYIVRIGYKYDYEKEYFIDNEYMFFYNGDYVWESDWDEGQEDVILIDIISMDDIFDTVQNSTAYGEYNVYGALPPEIVRDVLKTGLLEWKIRVLLEYWQLRGRLDKLQKALLKTNDASKDIAQRLTDTERMLMVRQESAMQMYLKCLKKRAALHGFDNLLDKTEKL